MLSRYGETWRRSFGASPSEMAGAEWGSCLAPFTREDIDRGFDLDARRASEFPPSSVVFAALCGGYDETGVVIDNPWDRQHAPRQYSEYRKEALEEYRNKFHEDLAELQAKPFLDETPRNSMLERKS